MPAVRRVLDGQRAQRVVVGVVFLVAALVGVRSAGDFGVSWDEPDYYRYGELVQTFYQTGDRSFEELRNLRYYGAAVPVLHAVAADAADSGGSEDFALAHLVNYAIFLVGAVALYLLLHLQTGSRLWAALGPVMLVLSPRIFSHAFVNPKDGPFLAITTAAIALLVHYLERRRPWALWGLGIATGLLLGTRVTGLFVVGLVLLALGTDAWAEGADQARERWVHDSARYLGATGAVALLTWPFLWPNPPARFAEAISLMTSFTVGPQEMLYSGGLADVAEPPWHYVPVWIGITTPMVYLVLAALGLVVGVAADPIRAFRTRSPERHLFLYAIWLFGPILLVIASRSALYDEWRHVNFVYPALVIFAVLGARWLWSQAMARHRALGGAFLAVLCLGFASVGRQMADDHPYQAVYFNELVGGTGGASGRFELDYWGLSYRDGLQLILDEVPRGEIKLYGCTLPAVYNAGAVDGGERFDFVDRPQDADFAICAPRDRTLAAAAERGYLPRHPDLGTVERDGVPILWVKDLRGP